MDRGFLRVLGLAWACLLLASSNEAVAQASDSPIRFTVDTESEGVPARLVQRRGRFLERQQLKEMEDYFDDLEDFYKDRNPQLADYYESWEKYYENVRKGKPAYQPPELAIDQEPGDGPFLAAPGFEPRQPRIAYRQPIQVGPHTNLERTYRELQRQFAGLTTGDTWLRYLALPFDAQQRSTSLDLLMTEKSKAQFTEAMQRFDQTANDPEYKVIARLPAFNRTRFALRSFTQWLERQPTLPEPEEVVGEELPLTPPPEPQPPAEPQPPTGPVLPPQ